MKPIIIFGKGKITDVIQYYMREESNWPVAAFTVDREFISAGDEKFNGLPLASFDEVADKYPPQDYDMFIAVGYQDMNGLRKRKVEEAKSKGYKLVSYVHPHSSIPKDLVFGSNCFIMNNVCIHPRVKLGDDVFVWSGSMIGHHSTVGSHTWLTSSANVGGNVNIGESCFLAMNVTVSHSVSIGNEVFLGSNTLITKNLADQQVVIAENHKPFRLNSYQFLKMSGFSNL
uniref:Mannose-1-phosphate guanyltransferase C-terminal domain-containing protein n=1 Tax=Roseihalotalea indica TaxID=2867963 RepID=A0AA49GLF0_9BACT|nr:hypothetical protein K4G66_31945 [Tunicatimonas sp. TK19036]